MSPKGPSIFFWCFAIEWIFEIPKDPPFTVLGIVRLFKMNVFVLKLCFLMPSTLYPNFRFFSRPAFSPCDFFLICFYRNCSHFLLETFCEHKGHCIKVFGTMRLAEDLHQNIFSSIIRFLKWFFCCFQLEKKEFRVLCVFSWVFLVLYNWWNFNNSALCML